MDQTQQNIEKNDPVNRPSHYTWLKDICGIEVIDITRHMDFDLGNAIKYILRAGRKAPSKTIEDLKKAVWYINDEIKQLEKEQINWENAFSYDARNDGSRCA